MIRSRQSQSAEITAKIPCRNTQTELLLNLFGQKHHYSAPSFFLYGHTGTGKSLLLNSVLKTVGAKQITVNCVECYMPRLMYEHILNQLSDHVPCMENDYTSYVRCDSMNDFLRIFTQILKEKNLTEETIYIVLDKAERLREMDANILPAFLRLQELIKHNVTVVLVSSIVWEKFRCGTGYQEPFLIHFPDYSKEELVEIMSLDCPAEYPSELYTNYTNLLLSVFYLACRNLQELRHLALLNFAQYVEPINAGEAQPHETRKLWRNIEPCLKKALQTLYLREVSSAQWERMQLESSVGSGVVKQISGASCRASVELPFLSKYLVIAAYLASYNPVKSDKRFFSKHAGKINKRKTAVKKHERTTNQMLGPKPFPLDRLLAIFYSIVESRVAPTLNIWSQISSLVTLRLISQVAGDDQLDTPKYKCLVSLEFIKTMSRSVNFDVVRYLYDFI